MILSSVDASLTESGCMKLLETITADKNRRK